MTVADVEAQTVVGVFTGLRQSDAIACASGLRIASEVGTMLFRDGIEYNLAFIPATFNERHKEAFDREYMQKLFDVGFEMGQKGGFWKKMPPAFEVEIQRTHL